MLVDLETMKEYLGVTGTDDDTFLTLQLQIVSEAVEQYCRRKFEELTYSQTFYSSDYQSKQRSLPLYMFPVIEISSIEVDEEALEDVRLHKKTGIITHENGLFDGKEMIVNYTAGFEDIPVLVQSVVMQVVEERYTKKKSGVPLTFGSDVQRVSIPGTISIDFDYSLSNNDRTTPFGTILGNHLNVLDSYRSERAIVGSGRLEYVDEEG